MMTLDSVLAEFIARTASVNLGEPIPGSAVPGAEAQAQLVKDLEKVSRASTIWCAAMVALVVALGVASIVVAARESRVVSMAGAGAFVLALQRSWRRKVATDLLIAFLKVSGADPKTWRLFVVELRKQI